MDENTSTVETVETSDTSELDAAFDEVWDDTASDDDDFDLTDGEADETPDAQPEETEAAEETADEPESSDGSEEQQESKTTENGEKEGQNQFFKIKVNGQEKEVSLAEITELAQKGSDYDRVKQERDSFKQDAPTIQKYKAYEAFLKELADGSGTDIESLMDSTRVRLMMKDAENRGESMTEEQALSKAKAMRQPKEEGAENAGSGQQQEDPEAANRQMLLNFIAIYPDVDAESIPKEVWDDSYITGDLVGAYSRYENRQLKGKIAALEQNQKNRERSTGSRRSAGAATPKDAFDEGWDSF